MRYAISLLAILLVAPLPAQGRDTATGGDTTRPTAADGRPSDAVATWLDSLARDAHGVALSRSAVREGDQVVGAGDTIAGSIAAYHGDLDIYGHVRGHAVAAGGDVVLHAGAEVDGDAIAVGGEVRNDGGTVAGEMRSLSALTVGPTPATPPLTSEETARRAVSLSVGWYLVLTLIGLAVVLFARSNLETIAERIRTDFTRSFLYGLVGHVLFIPALVVGVAASAITVIGIVLIPFIIVGFFLAAAGALALGFVAMSFVIGDAAMRWRGAAGGGGRAQLLQFLIVGLSIFLVLWVIAGAAAGFGWLGGLVRFVCMVLTWVAATAGLGATLASRGGTRSPRQPMLEEIEPADELSWQTPTPVSGVAAARRPPSSRRDR